MIRQYSFYKILVLGLTALFLETKAQETVPFYQQYLVDGDYLFNPALYGKTDDVVLNLNYQKQFTQLAESPNVQMIGLHANVFDRVGMGVSFFRDQNGPISSNGIMFGASYFVPISDEYDRQDQFSFGLGTNLYNMNIDYTQLSAYQSGDPLLGGGNESSFFVAYANLGAAVQYQKFFAGVSVIDIPLNNDVPIVNGIEPSPTKFYTNIGYDWELSNGIFITPSFMMNLNTNSSRIMDYNIMARFGEEDNISIGASIRSAKTAVGSQNLGLSPIIKGKIGKMTFGAVYNFGISELAQDFGKSFMLSVGFNVENFINSRGYRYR